MQASLQSGSVGTGKASYTWSREIGMANSRQVFSEQVLTLCSRAVDDRVVGLCSSKMRLVAPISRDGDRRHVLAEGHRAFGVVPLVPPLLYFAVLWDPPTRLQGRTEPFADVPEHMMGVGRAEVETLVLVDRLQDEVEVCAVLGGVKITP